MTVASGKRDVEFLSRTRPETPSDARLAEEQARWMNEVYRLRIAEKGERKKFRTDCEIDIEPLYTPQNLTGFDYLRDLGFPGEFPFTRGDRSTMYREEAFVVSAYTGFGEAGACNKRFKRLIELGVEQILIAFDLPTQCGYDSDHIMSTDEVGRVGVAINSLADLEELFAGIPLNSIKRVGTLGNSIGPFVLALFAALGEKQGLRWSDYVVNLQNDVLKEYLARGTQILPPAPAAKLDDGLCQSSERGRRRLQCGNSTGARQCRPLPRPASGPRPEDRSSGAVAAHVSR